MIDKTRLDVPPLPMLEAWKRAQTVPDIPGTFPTGKKKDQIEKKTRIKTKRLTDFVRQKF